MTWQSPPKRVLIIQSQMKQYRVPFYVKVADLLNVGGVRLEVVYSTPSKSEAAKKDNADLPEEFSVKVHGLWWCQDRFLFQPVLSHVTAADLVVVEHASKHVINHALLMLRLLRLKRFALWGLGSNKQADRSALSEWYKRLIITRADWYFAYTRKVAEEVSGYGVPAHRITAVENAVDTHELQGYLRSMSASECDEMRRHLGIGVADPVGVFCGMLDPVKGVPFLIDCARLVRQAIPNFHLLLVGGGQDESKLRALIQELSWVHMVGPKFGRDKALAFKIADVFLIPGRVGLAILDSFAAHLPLLTIRTPIHGPEAEYLEDGVNGFMVERDASVYAETVVRVLKNPDLLRHLRKGAAESAKKYSIDNMARNFASGIQSCLEAG